MHGPFVNELKWNTVVDNVFRIQKRRLLSLRLFTKANSFPWVIILLKPCASGRSSIWVSFLTQKITWMDLKNSPFSPCVGFSWNITLKAREWLRTWEWTQKWFKIILCRFHTKPKDFQKKRPHLERYKFFGSFPWKGLKRIKLYFEQVLCVHLDPTLIAKWN